MIVLIVLLGWVSVAHFHPDLRGHGCTLCRVVEPLGPEPDVGSGISRLTAVGWSALAEAPVLPLSPLLNQHLSRAPPL
jgi:hypothetical protein